MAGVLDRKVSTPVGDAPIVPVALMVAGLYLAWFGVHYWRTDTKWPSDPIKAVLTGKPIPPADRSASKAAIDQITGAAKSPGALIGAAGGTVTGGGQGVGAAVGGAAIAQAALKYRGAGYVWGGRADAPGDWDCSSFVSYVIGHDLGYKLPLGGHYGDAGFPPHGHGPTTFDYLMFGTPVNLSEVLPGDLVVSSEHMGIATDATNYISAHSPSIGTTVSSFVGGFPGGPPVFRRIT
jgi:cell wall-associated NlpC family hydrolase